MDLPAQRPPLVLSLTVGSSSLKAAVRDPGLRLHIEVSGLDGPEARLTVSGAGSSGERAVVHRIGHSSPALAGLRRADAELLAGLRDEAQLDPLHLPRQLAVVEEAVLDRQARAVLRSAPSAAGAPA